MTIADEKPRLIVVVGPTGAGKTKAALSLAAEMNAEIVSADAMQVYRHMDIGTAKPTSEQRARIRHHLLDVVAPDEPFNASLFITTAQPVIADLHAQGKNIFVVGGTGLYIKALLGGLFTGPQANKALRASYRKALSLYGPAYLHEELSRKDRQAAQRINPRDFVRVIRALEVIEISGKSIVEQHGRHEFGERRYDYLKIGLQLERGLLFDRIAQRTDAMIREGFAGEVRRLLQMGYAESLKSMQSLGYKQMVNSLQGRQDLIAATEEIKSATRRYAKRQMTWFGADKEIAWFEPDDLRAMEKSILTFLKNT